MPGKPRRRALSDIARPALRRLTLAIAALASLLAGAPPAIASHAPAWPLALRAQMLRLAEVDWRLRLAATPRCPQIASGIGVAIDHAAAYPQPTRDILVRKLRLGDLPQVAAVVAGSPAARAGIRPGDELLSIGAATMASELEQSADPALFADEVMDRLAALPAGHPATLVLQRGRARLRKTVVPITICASRTMLDTGSALDAYSDAHDVAVTSALIDFTANDDELALIVGHEFAHVILHRAADARTGDPIAAEQEADILGSYIARCAGYDLGRGVEFWPRFAEHDLWRQERLSTHPSPDQREQRIHNAAASFTCPVK